MAGKKQRVEPKWVEPERELEVRGTEGPEITKGTHGRKLRGRRR